MSNVSRLGNHNDEGCDGILLSPQVRPMPGGYVRPRVLTESVYETDDITLLMQYLRVLWKHKWMVLFGALLGILTGLGISLWMTPQYRATSSIEIQNVQDPFTPSVLGAADPSLGTQVQLLSSQTMRNRVERKLDANPAQFPNTRDPLIPLRGLLGLADPGKSIDWIRSVSMAAATRRVTTSRDSRILIIESRSPNPQAAADFTNTLAQEYMARNQEERWESYQSTGEWLTRAQAELKSNVEESERRLQDFAKANGLIITGSQNISEEKLRQLQTELARASVDRIAKQSVYESSLSSPTESLPEVLDSGPMAQYQVQIADLRRQLAELSTTLMPDHYKMQRVQAMIKEVETSRERERKNIISRIRIDYEAAQKRETQIEHDFNRQAQVLSGQGAELIQYNILLREVETNKKLYDQTLAQGKEAGLASAMRSSNARVVDTAKVPEVPQSPNVPLNLGLGLVSGLLCGMITVVVRSTMDARIQAPGTLGVHLNLRELGVIPSAALFPELRTRTRLLPGVIGRTKSKAKSESTSILLPREETKQPRESLELVAWTQKTSVISEAFRSVMTSILFSAENGSQPHVLVITSPSPQEGKTTVVSNLAIALAEINHRVLLIDADMRLPRLHSIFDLPNTFGLSDFLHERRPVEEYVDEELVRRTHISNLYIMPAGPARSNLSRLLYSVRMEELLSRFRGTFDTILIDSAPVLNVPDARILARVADAVVLVVRAHRTDQESAFAAVRCFEEDGRRILGTILNDWNPKLSPYAPYGQYGAYRANSSTHRAYGPQDSNYAPHIEGGERP